VGAGGFRIDLAIVDPERPGRYLLGIECDGATYHSARTARDRDRIRQAVLEGLGWRIHRIWSTDWFRDPQRELKRAVAAIERAKAEPVTERPRPAAPSAPTVVRSEEPPPEEAPALTQPYVVAELKGHPYPLHEVPITSLAAGVAKAVRLESPVHIDEVARRIMTASGVSRLGSRIREAIERAAQRACVSQEFERRGDFLYLRAQRWSDVPVRDRSGLPQGSRKFELIAPEEVGAAIARVLRTSFGIAAADLPIEVCRLLGFAQTSEGMRTAISDVLAEMQSAGMVAERHGTLTLTSLASVD